MTTSPPTTTSDADVDPDLDLDLDRAWDLHPQVSVRPEPFGALLYHFGTRKLSFLKDRGLLSVVQALVTAPTARAACAAAGVAAEDMPRYGRALAVLARSSMLVERTPAA
ncbi:mycofactocin biosynthesis chaperone MftB [Streptomyces sp. NPDC002088]|uniref:mycofactocin biosynthesis chaperone MftB n=1 Tax=Streptomyces sp. NPDC002088 TaxID=3154665 RepID=UPI003320B787